MINTTKYYYMKWLAVIFMTTDHIALFLKGTIDDNTYLGLRTIGRLAFPIFAFLLAESFHFTKNKLKHLAKITFLAVISEIPYNFFETGRLSDFRYQNVCFTLALGFLMMYISNSDMDKPLSRYIKSCKFRKFIAACIRTNITALFCLTAYLFNTDYGAYGILLIALFDTAKRSRYSKIWQTAAILLFICLQKNVLYLICLADLALIFKMCSRKGNNNTSPLSELASCRLSKTICGFFYPIHLAILALFSI